jgi:hypothetical protein
MIFVLSVRMPHCITSGKNCSLIQRHLHLLYYTQQKRFTVTCCLSFFTRFAFTL